MDLNRLQKLKRALPLMLAFALLMTGCSLTGKDPGPLDPKGTTGEEQFTLILLSSGVMFLVMFVVFVLFFYVVFRFRRKKGDDSIPEQVEGNHKLEIIWTVIPVLLLFLIAVPTLPITFGQATDYTEDPDAVVVKVTAHQFWWEFEYPEYGIFTAQDFVIPVDTKIQIELTASDVIHSFWVPALGGKIDTNPGMSNTQYLEATETGIFRGKCAEFCGTGHALMDFKAVVYTQDEFEDWVERMQTPASVGQNAEQGQTVFENKCMSCHAIDSSMQSMGPNLDGFGERQTVGGYLDNTDENIALWLTDTQGTKPGATMPQIPLTDQEVDDLVQYLNSLK